MYATSDPPRRPRPTRFRLAVGVLCALAAIAATAAALSAMNAPQVDTSPVGGFFYEPDRGPATKTT